MKIGVIYLHVSKAGYPEAPPPEHYIPFQKNFIDTYKRFNPGIEHELRVVSCGLPVSDGLRRMYEGVATSFDEYLAAGSDLGAEQDVMKRMNADFIVSLATPVSFWREGWLRRLAEAREKHGDGLYGPFASNEVYPHIRTSCWAVDRSTFGTYPHLIDTREKCYWAEHKDRSLQLWQFTFWYASLGKPTMMVTWDGEYSPPDWRTPRNIMYDGDQSNCLMHDKYTRLFECYSPDEKRAAAARIT